MLMMLAAMAVLVAGALLPLAFEESDSDRDEPVADRADPDADQGDFLDALGDEAEPTREEPPPDEPDDVSAAGSEPLRAEVETNDGIPAEASDPQPVPDMIDPEEGPDAEDVEEVPAEDVLVETREGRVVLTGTEGNDVIPVPERAFATGGDGEDVFAVNGSTAIGMQSEIADFDPQEDRLVVVWDDSTGAKEPELTLGAIEGAPDMAQVLVNGVVVAHVANSSTLTLDQIGLVPASQARTA